MPLKEHAHSNDRSPSRRQESLAENVAPHEQTGAAQRARIARQLLTPGDVLQLQRVLGNRAVGQLLHRTRQYQPIQSKGNNTEFADNLQSGIDNLPDNSIKYPSNPTASSPILQRKVGVEYETTWKVTGDNRENHKKPIYKGKGWHLESDNNNLEFVTYPPSNSPEELRTTVNSMAEIAAKIKDKAGDFDKETVSAILKGNTQTDFKDENFVEDKKDINMSAKAQFSFGLSMQNMTKFFDQLFSGNLPKAEASTADTTFNFYKKDQDTTRGFLEKNFKVEDKNSSNFGEKQYHEKLKGFSSETSEDMQGFLSYLGYYIKSMESEYNDTNNKYFEKFTNLNKAALMAQTILKDLDSTKTIGALIKELGYTESIINTLNFALDKEFEASTPINSLKTHKKILEEYVAERVKEGMDYPKYRFPLMNRSGFDKMYQTLSGKDQTWFKENIDKVIEKLGRKPDSALFASPYSYKKKADKDDVETTDKGFSHGPTLKEWLKSIVASTPTKRDEISPPKEFIMGNKEQDPDQSMGLLAKMDTSEVTSYKTDYSSKPNLLKPVKQTVKQTIIELRSWGDWITPDTWPDHSYDMAYLYGQMAPGDLNFDEKNKAASKKAKELNPLLQAKYDLEGQKMKITPEMQKGQKTHARLFNRGLRDKIFAIDTKIKEVHEKYK